MKNSINDLLSARSGLLVSYLGTLLMVSSMGFTSSLQLAGEGNNYPFVVATNPKIYQIGLFLIAIGFLLQWFDKFDIKTKILNFVIMILIIPIIRRAFHFGRLKRSVLSLQ